MGGLTVSKSITSIKHVVSTQTKGRKFSTELQLVTYLASSLKIEFQTDVFAREFTTGYGIADLVFARSFNSKKNKLDRHPINNYYSLLLYLSLSSSESFTVRDAKTILKTSPGIAGFAVRKLLNDGYITTIRHGNYIKTAIVQPEPLKLVAIEAKLHDWRQGILQARRYKSFTDESYLAILSRYAKNIDPDLLRVHDIGLIIVDEDDGTIDFKRRSRGRRLKHLNNLETTLYANEIFRDSFRTV